MEKNRSENKKQIDRTLLSVLASPVRKIILIASAVCIAIIITVVFSGVCSANAAQKAQMNVAESTTTQPLPQKEARQPSAEVLTQTTWTLEQLVNEAVTSFPETLAKRATLESSKAKSETAFWQFFPTPYADLQQPDTSADYRSTTIVGIKQPIWTGGKLTSGAKVAKSQVASDDSAIFETKKSVAMNVISVYQTLMQYRGRIAAAREYVQRLEGYTAMMRRRVDSQVSAEAEHSLVTSRLSRARSDLTLLQAGERAAIAQMRELTGRPLEVTDIDVTISDVSSPPREPDGIVEEAWKSDPTLRRLKTDIETAKHTVEYEKSAAWPTLYVKVQYQNYGEERFWGRTVREDTAVFMGVEYSPGAGLSVFSNIKAASAKVKSLKHSYEVARRDVKTKVISDYEDCLNAYSRRGDLKRTMQTSRAVLESYTRMFNAGKRSWLDVLNVAQELAQNEQSLVDVLALYEASRYRLDVRAGAVTWLKGENK